MENNPEHKSRRHSYCAAFKLQVIKAAEETDNSKSARKFGVDVSMVRRWRAFNSKLNQCPKGKKAFRGPSKKFPALENELKQWVEDSRAQGFIVTRTMIRLRALKLKNTPPYKDNEELKMFKASAGWCSRFMKREGLVLRMRTKLAQKLPAELEEKVMAFHRYTINLRKQNQYGLNSIGNMDETPLTFDIPSNQTVDFRGAKTVGVKTTGHEKLHFTCVLAITADGGKLPPFLVFKRKTIPLKMKFVPGVIVRCNPKGWMDDALTQEWLRTVWHRRSGAALGKSSMLVWDSFRAHLTPSNKKLAAEIKTNLNVIPGGLTGQLQPLDVSINKPFKDRMRQKWIEWMMADKKKLTAAGNLCKPDLPIVVKWVKESWESIPSDMIKKSFLKCGISNKLDGTEDDFIYVDSDDDINLEMDDPDDYTADIELLDDTYDILFPGDNSESDIESEGPDETFQIVSPSGDES